ncbi:MAG: hypothetical protein ABI337_01600 [Nitrososphaera sp.]|jgi:hypothetical protein
MQVLEIGTFILLNVFGFGLLGFCLYTRLELARYLLILPMMFFFVLAFYMSVDYEVGTVIQPANELHYNGTGQLVLNITKSTEKHVYISDFDTNWLTWVYLVLGMFCMIVSMYLWRRK